MNNTLKNSNYLAYIATSTLSRAGDSIQKIALILFMIHLGGSASSIGFLLVSSLLPSVIFGPIAGAISDRFSATKVIHVTYIIRALTLFAIPLVSNFSVLYIISFILSSATLFGTPGQKILLPLLVPKEQIATAAGYVASSRSIVDTLMPIFGSSLVFFIGYSVTFYTTAILYVLSSIVLLPIKINQFSDSNTSTNTKNSNFIANVKEGLIYIFTNKGVRSITIISILAMSFSSGINVLMPLHLLNHLGFSKNSYGFIMASIGLGVTLGGIFIPKLQKKFSITTISLLALSLIVDGVAYAILAVIPKDFFLALLVMLIAGVSGAGYFIMVDTYLQTQVKRELLGRTYSGYYMSVNIFSVLVMAGIGIFSDKWGTTIVFIICGIGIIVTGIYAYYLSKKYSISRKSSMGDSLIS